MVFFITFNYIFSPGKVTPQHMFIVSLKGHVVRIGAYQSSSFHVTFCSSTAAHLSPIPDEFKLSEEPAAVVQHIASQLVNCCYCPSPITIDNDARLIHASSNWVQMLAFTYGTPF